MHKILNTKFSHIRLSLATISLSLTIAIALLSLDAQAHYLWMETPSVVNTGRKAALEIYFGEYQEELREVSGGRLDERRGASARLLAPSGKTTVLSLKKKENHFSAQVKPTDSGIYHVLIEDNKAPVKDLTKYDLGVIRPFYYARRPFLSFAKGHVSDRQVNVNTPTPVLHLDIVPLTRHIDVRNGAFGPNVNEEMLFQVYFDEKVLTERAKVSIYSPTGWLWKGRLDAKGIGRFTPPWPGLYVVDVSYRKEIPGKFQGMPYQAESHRATLSVFVSPQGA